MNKLTVIGYLGSKSCYLNVPLLEAKRRYLVDNPDSDLDDGFHSVDQFTFEDEFDAYDAWGPNKEVVEREPDGTDNAGNKYELAGDSDSGYKYELLEDGRLWPRSESVETATDDLPSAPDILLTSSDEPQNVEVEQVQPGMLIENLALCACTCPIKKWASESLTTSWRGADLRKGEHHFIGCPMYQDTVRLK